jgi:DNA-binding NtrC family response regulator
VYDIIQQLGGCVLVESRLGMGTTFDIYLPRVEEQRSLFRPTEAETIPPPVLPTALVVEDEKTVRSLIGDILKEYNYLVLSAENAEEALHIARGRKGPIHLLVIDIVMPNMLGTQLATELQKLKRDAKVLLMSGYSDKEIVRRTQIGESVPFIQKPFTPEEFYCKVREVLNARGSDDDHLEASA